MNSLLNLVFRKKIQLSGLFIFVNLQASLYLGVPGFDSVDL
jgi:hypothetical protein